MQRLLLLISLVKALLPPGHLFDQFGTDRDDIPFINFFLPWLSLPLSHSLPLLQAEQPRSESTPFPSVSPLPQAHHPLHQPPPSPIYHSCSPKKGLCTPPQTSASTGKQLSSPALCQFINNQFTQAALKLSVLKY